jgi:hypothetical protein
MDFFTEIDSLAIEIKSTSIEESKIEELIEKCKSLSYHFFSNDNKMLLQLSDISTEPNGFYFPEMYQKEKKEALEQCIPSLLMFLKECKEEFSRSLIVKSFEEIIKYDESQSLEFKSTLCWDIKNLRAERKIMGEIIMKSICAFSNSEGGVLLIGVSDTKGILGLDADYKTFKNGSGSKDDFELYLTTLIANNFSKTFAKDNLVIEFPKFNKKEICLIRIKRSDVPYTVKLSDKSGQPKEKFFIRVKNSSRDIDDLIELARYIKKRFPNWQ